MNLTSSYLKKLISDKANELGFIQVGFSKVEILEKESAYLREWLDNGHAADMNWIEKGYDKRKDISLIMEDAKSVITLAYNYYTPFEHNDSLAKISRYAWGKDYHKILKKKLKELIAEITPPLAKGGQGGFINEYDKTTPAPLLPPIESLEGKSKEGTIDYKSPFEKGEERSSGGFEESSKDVEDSRFRENITMRAYIDDGPVMDKVWAARAGIGAMGKHTNIINPEYGSWIFICNIITNIEFDNYDSPIEDMCGSCTLCISACPTGAIIDEYKVDANLCISYQTIENRGDIPDSIDLDGWIFGCDVCQDVCPYNSPKYNHPTDDLNFYPKKELMCKTPLPPFEKGEEQISGGFENSSEDTNTPPLAGHPLGQGGLGEFIKKDDKTTPAPLLPPIESLEDEGKEGINDFKSPLTKGDLGGCQKNQGDSRFRGNGLIAFKTKAELDAITEEEFTTIFADSPVKRTKFKGWKRNLKRNLDKNKN